MTEAETASETLDTNPTLTRQSSEKNSVPAVSDHVVCVYVWSEHLHNAVGSRE
jgi:hypothetical protein